MGMGCALRKRLAVPHDRRMWAVFEALDRNWSLEDIHDATRIDPWFLQQFAEIADLRRAAEQAGPDGLSGDQWLALKRAGFGDLELSGLLGVPEAKVREKRQPFAAAPAYKRIDTCAAEFESFTPYMYGLVRAVLRVGAQRQEEGRHPRQRTESHRSRHRIRLLLLSRRLCPSR